MEMAARDTADRTPAGVTPLVPSYSIATLLSEVIEFGLVI